MQRTISDYSNYSQRSTVTTPRLKIRAAPHAGSPGVESLASLSLTSTPSFSSRNHTTGSSPARNLGSEAPSGFSSRRSSIISNAQPLPASDKLPKKRNFFSSLFSTKEPSIQALADYEKQLKKAGAIGDAANVTGRVSGVSSAKLPAHVPKTNSKWDGNPATANKVVKKDSNLSNDRLEPPSCNSFGHRSTHSSSSDSMRQSMRRPSSRATLSAASFHTAHSNQSRNQLAEVYGWEVADYSSMNIADSASSTSGTRAASLRSFSISASNLPSQDVLEPPQIPDEYRIGTPEMKPSSPRLPAYSHSPALTPREEAPVTPLGGSPIKQFDTFDSEKTLQGDPDPCQSNSHTTVVEASDGTSEVILTSSGANVLSPPITIRRDNSSAAYSPKEPKVEAQKEPKSILKKGSAYGADEKSQQQSTLDSLFSQTAVLDYYHGPQWKKKMGMHTVRRGQRQAAPNHTGQEGKKSPTPESGATIHRRKSIVGILKP